MTSNMSMIPSDSFAIETNALRKEFGKTVAVKGLSLQVPRGEIFGFLGPNGAGKSTSIKMLLGLTHRTSGDAFVLGAPAGTVKTRRRIGFLPEGFRFYEWLTATELLTLHAKLCGLSPGKIRKQVPATIDLVGLTPHRDRRVGGFSKGMLQRIGLAQAIVHEPDLIFLDEPTSGLDPIGRRMVRDILRAQRDRGATVFLNSHLLGEIEITCDRVVFIKNGEIVASHDLSDRANDEIRLLVRANNVSATIVDSLRPLCADVVVQNDGLLLTARFQEVVPEIVRALATQGADVYEITPQREPLEELFVRIMGKDSGL